MNVNNQNNNTSTLASDPSEHTIENGESRHLMGPSTSDQSCPIRARKPLASVAAAKQVARTKAYFKTAKGKEAKDRAAARQRQHNALRKSAKTADRDLDEARVLGKPAALIAQLEAQADEARKQLSTFEAEKEAAKEARRATPEQKRLQAERQKVLKRQYARRKQAEKKMALGHDTRHGHDGEAGFPSGSGAGRCPGDGAGQCGVDDIEHDAEEGEDEGVVMRDDDV